MRLDALAPPCGFSKKSPLCSKAASRYSWCRFFVLAEACWQRAVVHMSPRGHLLRTIQCRCKARSFLTLCWRWLSREKCTTLRMKPLRSLPSRIVCCISQSSRWFRVMIYRRREGNDRQTKEAYALLSPALAGPPAFGDVNSPSASPLTVAPSAVTRPVP